MENLLYLPLKYMALLFIPAPYFALIPAIFFGYLYFRYRLKLLWILSFLWLLYMFYEYSIYYFSTGEPIRVDLLLIYPLLILLSFIALAKIVIFYFSNR